MTSNLGYSKIDEFFIAQVAPGQNQYLKGAKWEEAHGDRVKIRIPGKHPSTSEIPDERLPWAVVAKPTSHGNRNGGSCGIWGGEWVMCCWLDEAKQIPAIVQVFGNNISEFDIRSSKNGTTEFKRVDRFNNGLEAANTQVVGSSKKPTGPAVPTKEEVKDATTDPQTGVANEFGQGIADITGDWKGGRDEITKTDYEKIINSNDPRVTDGVKSDAAAAALKSGVIDQSQWLKVTEGL